MPSGRPDGSVGKRVMQVLAVVLDSYLSLDDDSANTTTVVPSSQPGHGGGEEAGERAAVLLEGLRLSQRLCRCVCPNPLPTPSIAVSGRRIVVASCRTWDSLLPISTT